MTGEGEDEATRWSVTLVADGDRELTREEIVELADAVAPLHGVASGIGTTAYGAQILVVAEDRVEAAERARAEFTAAAARAGLPAWPISEVATLCERDELESLQVERVDPASP